MNKVLWMDAWLRKHKLDGYYNPLQTEKLSVENSRYFRILGFWFILGYSQNNNIFLLSPYTKRIYWDVAWVNFQIKMSEFMQCEWNKRRQRRFDVKLSRANSVHHVLFRVHKASKYLLLSISFQTSRRKLPLPLSVMSKS